MNEELLKVIIPALALLIALGTFFYSRHSDSIKIAERITTIESELREIRDRNTPERITRLETSLQANADNWREAEKELLRRLVNIESQSNMIGPLATKVDLFWGLVEEAMPRMLMKHNELERDVLLAKMENKTLQPAEAEQLKALLEVDLVHMEEDDKFKQLVIKFVIKRADLIARRIK